MSVLQQTMRRIGNSVIAGLVLTLLIPKEMIKGVIHGREQRREGVIPEVSSKRGGGAAHSMLQKKDMDYVGCVRRVIAITHR